MILVFDTSALSRLFAKDDRAIQVLAQQKHDQLLIPLAVDAEIRFGFVNGSRQEQNLANYEMFKNQFSAEIMPPDQDTAIIYAELALWARQNGIALSNNDTWIAATCVQTAGVLLTFDEDFKDMPQIRIV